MRGTTLEVAMLADVSGAYSLICSVNLFVTGPLWHQPSSLPFDIYRVGLAQSVACPPLAR